MNALASLHASSPEVELEPLWESRPGRIIGTDGEGRPLVDFEGNPVGPCVARRALRLDAAELQAAAGAHQPVELRFVDGDPRHPIIVALLPIAPQGAHSDALEAALEEAVESRARVIQAQDGIALCCGASSVTLLRNGKVSLKGTSIETAAEGMLRLKGISVRVHTPGARATDAREDEARSPEAGGLLPAEDAAGVQVIQSQERLTLRRGQASLTLLRSGRILLKGTYVETCARGVIRLRGGSVRIN